MFNESCAYFSCSEYLFRVQRNCSQCNIYIYISYDTQYNLTCTHYNSNNINDIIWANKLLRFYIYILYIYNAPICIHIYIYTHCSMHNIIYIYMTNDWHANFTTAMAHRSSDIVFFLWSNVGCKTPEAPEPRSLLAKCAAGAKQRTVRMLKMQTMWFLSHDMGRFEN